MKQNISTQMGDGLTVGKYMERASNGRKIGMKTIIYLGDGRSVKFMELLTKREAIYMINKYQEKGILNEIAKFEK